MTSTLAGQVGGDWDCVVIGAGPAGSLTARELARLGRRVLLVEKATFPRWKVCGACLGAAGVGVLERVGLGDLLATLGATRVRRTELRWRSRTIDTPMRGMVAVSRGALDGALAVSAVDAGASFVQGVVARFDDQGLVTLERGAEIAAVRPACVVVAGGLRLADAHGVHGAWVDRGSYIGLGVSVAERAGDLSPGILSMAIGERGYVGRVVTEDGRTDWAAALDPASVRRHGSPTDAVRAICRAAGVNAEVPEAGWVGTPALTRRTPAQRGRVYRVGDAAGYIEPITGEGMSWGLLGAEALAPVLDQAIAMGVHDGAWNRVHTRLFAARRARCRLVARALRSPAAVGVGFAAMGVAPARGGVVGRLIGAGGMTGGVR